MSKTSFPLRLHEEERTRAKKVAEELGISENRLYSELIHDGLLIREHMAYRNKLREIASTTSQAAAMDVLSRAPDSTPLPTDR